MIAVIIIGIHRKIKLLVLVKTIEAIKGIPPPNIILAMLYEIKNLLRMLKAPLIIQMHLKSLFDLF